MSVLATLQPRVPAPSKRHFVFTTFSRSKEGTSLHRISFRFRSTDDSASLHIFSEHSLWLHVALRELKKKKSGVYLSVIITFSGPYIRWGWPSGVPWRPWGSSPNQHFSGMLWKDKINTHWSNRQNVVHDRHYSVRQNQSKHSPTQGLANSLQPLINK